MKDLFTKKEVQEFLSVSETTVRKLVNEGILTKYSFPNSRRVYFKKSEVQEVLFNKKI